MPLVTRQAVSGRIFKQADEPTDWTNGDIWVDTDTGQVNVNISGTATAVLTAGLDFTNTIQLDGGANLRNDFLQIFDYVAGTNSNPFTFNDITNSNTNNGEQDEIDGGHLMTTAATVGSECSLSLNNAQRVFDPADCTIYGSGKYDNASQTFYHIGISNTTGRATWISCRFDGENNLLVLNYHNGTTQTAVNTDINPGTTIQNFKIVSNGSTIELFVRVGGVWVSKASSSTNLPSLKMQPFADLLNVATATAKTGTLQRLRVINGS